MSLQDFLVYDKVDQNIKKQEPLLLEDRRFYVYALLDPRKIGARIYRDLKYVFTLEPFYIGYGHNLRFYDHFKEADNLWEKSEKIQKCGNPMKIRKIHQIYRDYDLPRVVIIKEGLTLKEALEYEIFCITQIGRLDLGLGPLTNLTDGGTGGFGFVFSEELKELIGQQKRGKSYIEMYGEKRAKAIKEHLKESHKGKHIGENNGMFGKHLSEEHIQSIRKANIGRKKSQEEIEKISKANKGKPKSKETKQRLREVNIGKIYIYNKELDICKSWNKDQPIPEGFIQGRRPLSEEHKNNLKNRIWIYNKDLDIQKMIYKDDIIPEGYIKGMRSFSQEHKDKISKAIKKYKNSQRKL